ncbi:MAG: HD-GYP domain-containing protein [Acidobacteriaceae bacterium]
MRLPWAATPPMCYASLLACTLGDEVTGIASPIRLADEILAGFASVGSILVVDNNLGSRDGLCSMLRDHHFHVRTGSGEENAASETAVTEAPDLIVLRAEGDAGRLLARMRASEGGHAPILLLVPAGHVSTAMEALRWGAYDYLVEPFTPEQLMVAARRTIDYGHLRKENELYRVHLEHLIAARTDALQHAMAQLECSYDATLEALGDALDMKDAETVGHAKRVTAYTLALGRAVGLGPQELRIVGRGAFLHDIGKMAIPDSILRKTSTLTPEEHAIMRTHSELGYRMLRKVPFLREAAEAVYAHQERYDGSGYPRGLRAEHIPIGARIFALADTLDAMTSDRPYRKAVSIADARKEILRCAGTQFDPAIVDVMMAMPDSLWQGLRDAITREGAAFSPFDFNFGDGL